MRKDPVDLIEVAGVGLIITSMSGHILAVMDQPDVVVKEWKDSALGQYSIPFGRREPGENIFEAASREGREETGLVLDPNKFQHISTLYGYTNHYHLNVAILKYLEPISSARLFEVRKEEYFSHEIAERTWYPLADLLSIDDEAIRCPTFEAVLAGLVTPYNLKYNDILAHLKTPISIKDGKYELEPFTTKQYLLDILSHK